MKKSDRAKKQTAKVIEAAARAHEALDYFNGNVTNPFDELTWPSIAEGYLQVAQKRSEEHTSELQSLMRISYAVFCLKKKNNYNRLSSKMKKNKSKKRNYNYHNESSILITNIND